MTGMNVDPEDLKTAAKRLHSIEEVLENSSNRVPDMELKNMVENGKPEQIAASVIDGMAEDLRQNLRKNAIRISEHAGKLNNIAQNHEDANANIARDLGQASNELTFKKAILFETSL